MSQMQVPDKVLRIALAGLLHDIGKFAQRAGWRTGRHPEIGGDFVREFVPPAWREGLYPVMGHHDRPLHGYETKVVALADRLSAGERLYAEEEQPEQLLSIFCSITVKENDEKLKVPEDLYWPLQPLHLDRKAIFPEKKLDTKQVQEAYSLLWKSFEGEIKNLLEAHQEGGNLYVYLESLLLLLQRYTWCVPSAYYRAMPDVSLYDHSRITAALAVCLLDRDEAILDEILRELEKWERGAHVPEVLQRQEIALLVGGDISGVQDFIYTITARGATSALRGRSFYLQLLTEAVARYTIRRLGLPTTNLLYQGGGGFYLLAHPADRENLENIRKEVSRILLAHHRGDLYLALTWVPLVAADFYDGRISGRWEELGRRLQKAKQSRFAELKEELADLFKPEGYGGTEEKECKVCSREHPDTREEAGVRKCPPCLSYEELGDALRYARYLWMMELNPSVPQKPFKVKPGGWEEVLANFGVRAGVVKEIDEVLGGEGFRWILALKDEAMGELKPDSRTVIGRRFLVNVTPTYKEADFEWMKALPESKQKPLRDELPESSEKKAEGKVKSFLWLAAQSKGIKRLGVLRMDVDNLGELFSKGLSDKATLSRVAALSFAISLFFEGWVEALTERLGNTGDGCEHLYSIYSGGDDLFFVGSWDAVVELARSIKADFSCFVANHPGIHVSAGIALVGGKYPLYQAAADAGEAEEEAKRLCWWDESGREHRKNAISFLGQTVPWPRFGIEECREGMETVHAMTHLLERLSRPEKEGGAGAPRALLQMLIRLQEQYEEAVKRRRLRGEGRNWAGQEQGCYGPWMWRGYYFLKRMAERYKKTKPEVAEATDKLAEELHKGNFRAIEWIGLAARWAELLGRD